MYGALVPGGWPDRGPFRVVGDFFRRIFGRRQAANQVDATERADGEGSESAIAEPAQEEPDK